MKAKDLLNSQFCVIESDWSRSRALDESSTLDSGYLIVRKAMEGPGQADEFYLLALDEALKKLKRSRAARVANILNLHTLVPMQTFRLEGIQQVIDNTRDLMTGVVLDGGHPVGVIESPATSKRSQPPSGGDGTVTRYLVGEMPSKVKVQSQFALTVNLTSLAIPGSNAATVQLPPGSKIDVIVNTVKRLRVVGDAKWSCEVKDPQPPTRKQFELEATEPGEGRAEVCAYYKSGALVTIPLTTEIAEALPAAPPPATEGSARLKMDPRREPPDLTLFVFEKEAEREISFFLQSKDGRFTGNQFGPTTFKTPREYFDDFFRTIENLSGDGACRELGVQGLNLFREAVPPALRTVLWNLRERVQTLHILSDEPWVPWEVCRMQGIVDGRIHEGPFFGEAFNVTRWFRSVPAVSALSLRKWAIVVPLDSGLEAAQSEKRYLLDLKGEGRDVVDIPPTLAEVTRAMASGDYDVWHFTGHARAAVGVNANNATIELTKPEKMTPAHIVGETQNVLQKRPLVFLNACQSGRSGMSLSGAGGWAKQFVKVEENQPSAAAFIGTYWSVDDAKAFAFAQAFYDRLMQNVPIAQAAREARLAIRDVGDSSWLAYTVYADPSAKLA